MTVGTLTLATIERPWLANPNGAGGLPRESCVPEGLYNVLPHDSKQFGAVWALVNQWVGVYYQPGDIPAGQAWGRSAILIHSGNLVTDVIGCIAVGRRHDGEAVRESRMAIADLRAILGRERHIMQIRKQ